MLSLQLANKIFENWLIFSKDNTDVSAILYHPVDNIYMSVFYFAVWLNDISHRYQL